MRQNLLVTAGDDLARLREEDACRPATDVLDAVCVSCEMIGQCTCSRDATKHTNDSKHHAPQRSENM